MGHDSVQPYQATHFNPDAPVFTPAASRAEPFTPTKPFIRTLIDQHKLAQTQMEDLKKGNATLFADLEGLRLEEREARDELVAGLKENFMKSSAPLRRNLEEMIETAFDKLRTKLRTKMPEQEAGNDKHVMNLDPIAPMKAISCASRMPTDADLMAEWSVVISHRNKHGKKKKKNGILFDQANMCRLKGDGLNHGDANSEFNCKNYHNTNSSSAASLLRARAAPAREAM